MLVVQDPPANAGDTVSISGSGRSPGARNGNLLQYSFWDNFMGRGARLLPRGHKESDTTEQLSRLESMPLPLSDLVAAPHLSLVCLLVSGIGWKFAQGIGTLKKWLILARIGIEKLAIKALENLDSTVK